MSGCAIHFLFKKEYPQGPFNGLSTTSTGLGEKVGLEKWLVTFELSKHVRQFFPGLSKTILLPFVCLAKPDAITPDEKPSFIVTHELVSIMPLQNIFLL